MYNDIKAMTLFEKKKKRKKNERTGLEKEKSRRRILEDCRYVGIIQDLIS